jgi:altronate hydrolase
VADTSGEAVTVPHVVPASHRFAIREVAAGDFVRQYGQPIGTPLGIAAGDWVTHDNMTDDVPVVRNLDDNLQTSAPDYFPADEVRSFMGFRRADGRVGTRNFLLIVPTSMCASHEASQISMMSEFLHYSREKYPNVDGVVAIPHNKGCGCQDGSTLDVMMRTLANYADHPNVGGVILIDLGCEKTNLSFVEKYLTKREKPIQKPVFKIGIQDVGGTQAAIEIGLKEVEKMLPEINKCVREEFPVSELVLGVKCGSSDGFSGIRPILRWVTHPICLCAAAERCCLPKFLKCAAPNIFWQAGQRIPRPDGRSTQWSIGTRIMHLNSERF